MKLKKVLSKVISKIIIIIIPIVFALIFTIGVLRLQLKTRTLILLLLFVRFEIICDHFKVNL